MKSLIVASLLLAAAIGSAQAADGAQKASNWSLGGAASSAAEGARLTVWGDEGLAMGVAAPPPSALSENASGMQTGGFLAWRGDSYRLDATLAPSNVGTVAAGLGAAAGALPGELGPSYGLRLGAVWSADQFTLNPSSGASLAQVVAPANDVNLTFTVNHALTPNLSVVGTAEASRAMGPLPDSGVGLNHFLLGAGLGYRF